MPQRQRRLAGGIRGIRRDLSRLSQILQNLRLHPVDRNLDPVPVGMFVSCPKKPSKVVDQPRIDFSVADAPPGVRAAYIASTSSAL